MKNHIFTLSFTLLATVVFAQPNADFSFFPDGACSGTTINFTDESTGDILTYIWDFGDGTTSTVNNPTHVYTIDGVYTVCLTVTDQTGSSSTNCQILEVDSGDISFVSVQICEGEDFFYNGQIYQSPGNFIVIFPGASFNGCDSVVALNIDVFPTSFTSLQFSLCEGESVVVNGTVYDLNNPIGTELLVGVNGCDSIINVSIQEGLEIIGNFINITCDGSPANIDIEVNTGVAPYIYEWYDAFGTLIGTTQDLVVEIGGTYTVQVMDADGCTGSQSFSFIIDPPITFQAAVSSVACNGAADGSISLTVAGGAGVYTYQWSNGNNTQNINGLSAGDYTITITDANGCIALGQYTIVEPSPLVLDINSSDIACNNDGFINVTASGGVPPYEYIWNTGATGPSINNLIAGTYNVTVNDANGCTITTVVLIASPLDLSLESTFADCDMDNGTATATLNGVSNPSFLWSNNGTTATQTGLAPGWYSVTVSDPASNCQTHQNIEVLEDSICYVVISGQVLINPENPNCEEDANTIGAPFVMVELSDGQTTFTDANGYYEFTTDAGTYSISLNYNTALYESLCTDDIVVEANEWGQTYADQHFFLTYGVGRDLELKIVKQNARPGFSQFISICLMNVGAVPVSGTLTFVHPEIQDYQNSNPAADNYDATTQTLSWEFENIQPNQTFVYYSYFITPIGTPLGTQLDYEFLAEPVAGDVTPENNEKFCSIEVTGSYDPNDKQVEPAGIGPEGIISMSDSLLTYKIRFQNTGTDTAFTVLIRDTLDANLDIASLMPGPSSHSYTATINDANVLELLFENILLPDSFINEPASNGFVIFDINLKPDLEYGTRIENRAGIYFDFNPPIITNTVVNSLQMITAIPEPVQSTIPLQVHPNPFDSRSLLEYQLPASDQVNIALYNLQGQLVHLLVDWEERNAGPQEELLQNLQIAPGVYSIQVMTSKGERGVLKFVKH